MRNRLLARTLGYCALAFISLLAVETGTGEAKPRRQPAPTAAPPAESAEEIETRMVSQIMMAQPVGLPLYGDVLGWVKRCAGEPLVCTVSRGFSLDPAIVPSMKTTITTTSTSGTHLVGIAVPLDQNLKSGFALRGDGNDASLGTYSRCSLIGCAGDVVLTDAGYDALVASQVMDVILKDINGRTVMYQAPLDGLGDAIKGPALSDEDFIKAMQAAGEKMVAVAQQKAEIERALEEAGAAAAQRGAAGAAPASEASPIEQPSSTPVGSAGPAEPAKPVEESAKPTEEPARPAGEPVTPAGEPAKPAGEPVRP